MTILPIPLVLILDLPPLRPLIIINLILQAIMNQIIMTPEIRTQGIIITQEREDPTQGPSLHLPLDLTLTLSLSLRLSLSLVLNLALPPLQEIYLAMILPQKNHSNLGHRPVLGRGLNPGPNPGQGLVPYHLLPLLLPPGLPLF